MEAAGTRAHEAEAELASKHALVQSLEEDLLAAQKGSTSSGEPSVLYTRQYLFVMSTPVLGFASSCQTCITLTAMLAGNGRASNGAHTAEAAALLSEDGTGDEDGGQQTMIRVIASQRDRLKERVNQLGDELSKVSLALWVL